MYQHYKQNIDFKMGHRLVLMVVNLAILLNVTYAQKAENSLQSERSYELVYAAETWVGARDECVRRGQQLAVPESQEEFLTIQSYVRRMKYSKIKNADYRYITWVGLSNLHQDLQWKTITGKHINATGFNKFSSTTSTSSDPAEPHCAGVDAKNLGYRDWWCHQKLPYICQNKK